MSAVGYAGYGLRKLREMDHFTVMPAAVACSGCLGTTAARQDSVVPCLANTGFLMDSTPREACFAWSPAGDCHAAAATSTQ